MRKLNIIFNDKGLWSSSTFGCSGGSRPSDKGGLAVIQTLRWEGGAKKFFSVLRASVWPKNKGGPLPWIDHWVEFWLHVTVYTVYTWLQKGRLNFIAFHFTFLCLNVATEIPHMHRDMNVRRNSWSIALKKLTKDHVLWAPLPTHWKIGHWSRVSAELLPAPVRPHGRLW